MFALELEGPRSLLVDPELERSQNRISDGRCDAASRFWFRFMNSDEERATGALLGIGAGHNIHLIDDGCIAANGPAFSPDGRTLYESDIIEHAIYASDVDAEDAVANRRVFARFDDDDGRLDSLTVGADGGVWAPRSDGWALTRFSPSGKGETTAQFPAARVMAWGFGGRDLDRLYTTARTGVSAAELTARPPVGGLFALNAGVRGRALYEYGG